MVTEVSGNVSVSWYAIRAWHAARPGTDRTLCGRRFGLTRVAHPTRPEGKSCESCLRILTRLFGE